ncbi:MAG: GNAT family N-acetyltransferase [Planctomycetota bacterium]
MIALKDGRRATICEATLDDLETIWQIEVEVTRLGHGVVRTMDELDEPAESRRKRFKRALAHRPGIGAGGVLLLARVGGIAAGAGSIKRLHLERIAHVGTLWISIRPEFQGLGLGRTLMGALLDWARVGAGAQCAVPIRRVELNVLADNARAIALYESMGFECEGRKRGHVRMADGAFEDDLVMARCWEPSDRLR